MQNLVVVSHTVCVHVGGLKNFWDGAQPSWDGGVANPIETCFSPLVLYIPCQIRSL